MGCTSSAPNIVDIHTNATETSKAGTTERTNQEDEIANVVSQENLNMNVLPTCDKLFDNSQSANRTDVLQTDLTTVTFEKEIPSLVFGNIEDQSFGTDTEKITSFRKVADMVIVNKMLEDIKAMDECEKNIPDITVIEDVEQKSLEETEDVQDVENKVDDNVEIDDDLLECSKEENIQSLSREGSAKEHESPTQSDCSKSTRWEALADIAAELPPSLAVDPVTGHIYSLAK